MAATISPNEEAQLTQTIEMFEVITQSQPLDYQSLEILKEAYSKLNRQDAVAQTSKRIADAYVQLGQLSSAILEYESILQRYPEDPDARKALADIENKANSFAEPRIEPEIPDRATALLKKGDVRPSPASMASPQGPLEDGRQQMQKIFLDAKLISLADFEMYWPTPNMKDPPRAMVEPFIHVLAEKQILPIEQSMKLLAEKARLAYLPLDRYDIDVEFGRAFPRETCMRWAVLPFDKMSKSIMVATTNPFNKQAVRELEAHSKARVIQYLATPTELAKILKKIFR